MDEISNIRAQVDVLEGRVEAVEAAERGTDDAQFGQEAGAGINQDPKGRKIWECEWSKENNCLMMFCPKGAVTVGTKKLDVDSTAAQREGDELKITTEGIWYLHVYNDRAVLDQEKPGKEESEKPEEQAEEKPNEGGKEDRETSILECEIVEISKSKDYIEKQFVVDSVVLVEREAEADEKSVDRNGGEDGENKLQIAHFNDTERDSGKGLEKRLKVDTKTGEVTAEDSEGLMLVGRKDGKVIYIPLTGDGEDPDEEPEEEKPTDPCDHDKGGGKEGGVSPEREEAAGGGGAAGGISAGGVAGGGEKHKGDDDCNCK